MRVGVPIEVEVPMRVLILSAFAAAALAAPAIAAKQCHFAYAEFEKAVPHFDIQSCPGGGLAADKGFCRLGLDGTNVRIYRFVFVEKEACLDSIEVTAFADFVKKHGAAYESK